MGKKPAPGRPLPPPDQQIFAQAVQHHQTGRIEEAEVLYKEILGRHPRHADSLHLLGVIAHQRKQHDQAVALIRQAIAINGAIGAYHSNLGLALKEVGRSDEAIASFRRAIALGPDSAACSNLGLVLRNLGRRDEAADCFRQALALRPDFLAARSNLGMVLLELGRGEEAVACFQQAVASRPDDPGLMLTLARSLHGVGHLDQAVACFQHAIALRPQMPEAHNSLGLALKARGQAEEAQACFRQALALNPDFPEALNNLGSALQERQQPADAITCLERALALRPDFPEARNNLGNALMDAGRLDEAAACIRQALAADPQNPQIHANLANALLSRGDLAEGWREYEWRWHLPEMIASRRAFSQPQWRGEEAGGRTLLVHAEQGFGDTLQFCRFAPLVAARGLQVILEVQKPLLRLLRGLPGIRQVIAQGEPLPPFDLHCPLLSLPLVLGITLDNLPAAPAYLAADPIDVARWNDRLAGLPPCPLPSPRRVGLVWAGSPRSHLPQAMAIDRRRSMALEALAPLFDLPGFQFVSLQKGGPAASTSLPLVDVMAEMADFADTAALIGALDLVISVDTAVAHLAAALGKPVWLLDRADPCWRWLREREDSPWYPALRLFRQARPGDWPEVVGRVKSELARFPLSRSEE